MSANLVTETVANLFSKESFKLLKFKSNEVTTKIIENTLDNMKATNNSGKAKTLRKFYDKLDEPSKLQFAKNIRKKSEKSETIGAYVFKIEKNVNLITKKMFKSKGKGELLTTEEKQFVEDFSCFFMKMNVPIKAIHSSYILTASYDWTVRELSLTMIRGRASYKFYNVPKEVWIHLSTLPAKAGTYWWDQWFKYTIAPAHTIRSQTRKHVVPKAKQKARQQQNFKPKGKAN